MVLSLASRHTTLRGLYVILDAQVARGCDLTTILKQAVEGGARLFQFRDKESSTIECYRRAVKLRQAAADAGALLFINDRCDLAMAVEADGVHLGQQDLTLAHARSLLGDDKIIGVSTHNASQVRDASQGGADYLGFGPIYPSKTKSGHQPVVGLEGLRGIRSDTQLPVFAIGGITLVKVQEVSRAGADGVAVVSGVLDSPDIVGAVRAFMTCLP